MHTQQFTATGTYSDLSTANLTDSVTWSSSLTGTATVSNTSGSQGLATGRCHRGHHHHGHRPGSSRARRSSPSRPAVLVSISVSPTTASVAAGDTAAVHRHGHLLRPEHGQNLTDSVTWSSSLTGTATVSNTSGSQGLATGRCHRVRPPSRPPSRLIPGTGVLTVTPGGAGEHQRLPDGGVGGGRATPSSSPPPGTYSDLSTART